jgi:hypothetical protein
MFRNLARLWRNDLIKNQSNLYKTIVFLFLQNFVFYLFFTRKFFSSQALDSFINTFSCQLSSNSFANLRCFGYAISPTIITKKGDLGGRQYATS